jgi:hypothetical protein
MRVRLVFLVCALALVAGCGRSFRSVGITHIRDPGTGLELVVTLATCNDHNVAVGVEETDEAVFVAAVSHGARSMNNCADGAVVRLQRPLGDRQVISPDGPVAVR